MPHFACIPAAALSDERVSDTKLRVLCAVGSHTPLLGGTIWPSVEALAKAANISSSLVKRALVVLEGLGYLRRIDRPGRTALFEVCLDVPAPASQQLADVTPTPKTAQEQLAKAHAQQVCAAIWEVYPKRDTPHLYPPALRAIRSCLEQGAAPDRLRDAAYLYAYDVLKKGVDPKYVKTIHKFYADGAWEHYVAEPRVHGRTREEWARSGQDVAEFDAMLYQQEPDDAA